MRKNFGQQTWTFPMPVFVIGSYDEAGRPNAMTAAWGGIYDTDQLMLCLSEEHKTAQNIRELRDFTVSFADAAHVAAADYVGRVSGNEVTDKVKRAGLTPVKSEWVNAPLFEELPVSAECRLIKINEDGIYVGEIINISAEEAVLDENGMVDVRRFRPVCYDPVGRRYLTTGENTLLGRAEGTEELL